MVNLVANGNEIYTAYVRQGLINNNEGNLFPDHIHCKTV